MVIKPLWKCNNLFLLLTGHKPSYLSVEILKMLLTIFRTYLKRNWNVMGIAFSLPLTIWYQMARWVSVLEDRKRQNWLIESDVALFYLLGKIEERGSLKTLHLIVKKCKFYAVFAFVRIVETTHKIVQSWVVFSPSWLRCVDGTLHMNCHPWLPFQIPLLLNVWSQFEMI